MLISQITSSSSASSYYSAQTEANSAAAAASAAPRYAADVQADPVSFATQHPKPIPQSVDLHRLPRVPEVAGSGPPIMQPMLQQPIMAPQSMMQQMPHASDSGKNMPGPPQEPTVSAKEQTLIDYWK